MDIYLKVNSGMNRLGSSPIACSPLAAVRAMANVGEMTLMSHFAEAERPDGISARWRVLSRRRRAGVSAFVVQFGRDLWHPEAHLTGFAWHYSVWRFAVRSVA
ncbi:alanine racemase [Shigella flexneri]